ncbi:hypothetical protein IJI94_01410 [Candidatus Saccharibacteria bacterium]|nr:hypothetical protein [Candidatus Saccharibacteria bacterium]
MVIVLIVVIVIVLVFGLTALTGAPYVPSLKSELNIAFTKLYKLGKKDLLVDLGSGDGKVLGAAISYGAKAVGVEINPLLVLWTKLKYRKAKVYCKNMFRFKLPKETTVVYIFGDSRDIKKIVEYVKKEATRLKKPLYLISLAFDITIPNVKLIKSISSNFLYKAEPTVSSKSANRQH